MTSTKPYVIAKRAVWEAYQQVKANRGAAGIDDETIVMLEQNLSRNLYKLWNRMSSGSYFPPPVKQVEIPKAKGGTRKLGIPTVSDRIAQTVVKRIIEPMLDPIFHPDSYGYRPGRSAKQAIAVTRKRCWQYDWVVEFDIKAAFDQIDHGLLLKAVRTHIREGWILLYVERWLTAPFESAEGEQLPRERGTPQGGVVSPILMNLFMHYTFDAWMKRKNPLCPFARYAVFTSFLPAVSADALKRLRQTVRGWKLNRQTHVTLAALATQYNPIIKGWWNYYGAFYQTAMLHVYQHIDRALERWARRKSKALSGRKRGGVQWLRKMKDAEPQLFHHWREVGNMVG